MKNYIKLILTICLVSIAFTGCEGDDSFFGDQIFNDDTRVPYVSIQDRNEDLEDIVGNNFWSFQLTAENDGNQVRIEYDSQDNNIVSHEVYVGFDSNDSTAPLESDVLLATITSFPTELIFTKEAVANALNVPVSDLDTGSVYFRGRSRDADGNVVDDPSNLEAFLVFERHAYFYEWPLNQ
ncbi:MAG: hypothetical protein MK211_10700 [Flavobacteriales bacterium]|jgi:hypothetical protein|uniref:hypothetical protein n=1 Tax=Candidatus Ulvibacter alkanivorans TaxID=2267620 RepID=UPI000DF3BAFB|nr:hypothetical protein [Candidatus Ulvibacter alkanivorans]MCH2490605.1 hypothetical protein [Flavobacteriales bacterium]